MRRELHASLERDRLGGSLCLLGGNAALLHVKARDVAGRVDVFEAGHPPVLVDGDEALERLRDPADSRALQPRESDDAIGDDDGFAHEKKLAIPSLRRIRAACEKRFPARRADREPRCSPPVRRFEEARSSGVTRPTVTPGICRREIQAAVISASSYAGRLQTAPTGTAKTTVRALPASISASSCSIRSPSAGPRNVTAPSTAGFGTAPQATRSIEYGIAPPADV